MIGPKIVPRMKHTKLVEDATRDPTRFYAHATDILRDRRLSDSDRLEILRSWERDARELAVAADEGMEGGEPNRLSEVSKALLEVESRVSPPKDDEAGKPARG